MTFPFSFPETFPGLDATAPVVVWATPEGPLHEKAPLVVAVRDFQGIGSVRIEVRFPTGYYEVAYDSAGFGRFYEDSSLVLLVPAGPTIGLAENTGPSWPDAGTTVYPVSPLGPTEYPYSVIVADGSNSETVEVTGINTFGRYVLATPLVNNYASGVATVRLAGTGIGGYYESGFTLRRRPHWPTDFEVSIEAVDVDGNRTVV